MRVGIGYDVHKFTDGNGLNFYPSPCTPFEDLLNSLEILPRFDKKGPSPTPLSYLGELYNKCGAYLLSPIFVIKTKEVILGIYVTRDSVEFKVVGHPEEEGLVSHPHP